MSPGTVTRKRGSFLIEAVPPPRGAVSLGGALAAAAALAALLVVVLLFLRQYGKSPPPPPEPALQVRLLSPRGALGAAPREFSWAAVPGADGYNVRISDADAIWPLVMRRTTATRLLLDEKESSAITPGRLHVWEVEALDSRGVPIATGATGFRVRPPGEA